MNINMGSNMNTDFWKLLDRFINESEIVIDRPKGSRHPHIDLTYAVDYGYLNNTESMDGGGIDVWVGSMEERKCDAIICTLDLIKRDSEIKLLIDCTEEEKGTIMQVYNMFELAKGIMLRRE